MPSLPKLSPTSYALLGLLARAPQSAYELNAVMQRSLIRAFWPRAESHVYSEPKKLLAHGLVSQRREQVNGRKRTVYTITDQGREALRAWMKDDANVDLRSQAEFMLKLILADSGTPGDAQKTLEKANVVSRSDLEAAIAGVDRVLSQSHYSVEGMPYNGIAMNLLADFLIARLRWGKYALDTSSGINEQSSPADKIALGRAAYREAQDKMTRALAEDNQQP